MSIDPFTGRNPSYCFVELHDKEDAAKTLQTMSGQDLQGRPVRIRLATAKREAAHSSPNRNAHRTQSHNTLERSPDPYAFDRWSQYNTAEIWTAPVNEGRRLYVGGLPRLPSQAALNLKMRELFKDYNIQAVSKLVSPHPSTNSEPGDHYYCFIDLATVGDAEQAELAFSGRATPWGGKYKVARSYGPPGKLMREQLHNTWPGAELAPRRRNLEGNWRRVESQLTI